MQHLEVYEIPPEASRRAVAIKMHPDARPKRVEICKDIADWPSLVLVCTNASTTQVVVDRYFRLMPRNVEVPSPAAPPEFIDSVGGDGGIFGLWEVWPLFADGKPVEFASAQITPS